MALLAREQERIRAARVTFRLVPPDPPPSSADPPPSGADPPPSPAPDPPARDRPQPPGP
jgi:hypothetical protein